mmetsp:Transcript_17587/g.30569  ORF Transcript_17587/g.30569 Transcript_17587/m.30569 type:complete len:376 (+) Transcript_17587:180-1307(+)
MAIHESRRKALSIFGTVNLAFIVIIPCLTFVVSLMLNLVYASFQYKSKWSATVKDINQPGQECDQGLNQGFDVGPSTSLMKSWCYNEFVDKGTSLSSLSAFKIHMVVIHESDNYESAVSAHSQLDKVLNQIQNVSIESSRLNDSEFALDVHILHDGEEYMLSHQLLRRPFPVRMRKMKSFVLAEIVDLALEIQASDYGWIARNQALQFCRDTFGNDLPRSNKTFQTHESSAVYVVDSNSAMPEEFPKATLWSSALIKDLPRILGITIQMHDRKPGSPVIIPSNIAVFNPQVWKDLGVFLAKLRAEWFLWPDAHLAKKRDDAVWTKFNSSRSTSWQQWLFRFQHVRSLEVVAVDGFESSFDSWKTRALLNMHKRQQ